MSDNAALCAACSIGQVVPVFILDRQTKSLGAASLWRLDQALAAFDGQLRHHGSRLILRQGEPEQVLHDLAGETGAEHVFWSRRYDPVGVAIDTATKAALKSQGRDAQSFEGFLLHEPWAVKTGQGRDYRVFTPFWRAMRGLPVEQALPAPDRIPGPSVWPDSDRLEDWSLTKAMNRGSLVLAKHARVGEAAAQQGFQGFFTGPMAAYSEGRNALGAPGTSLLSENLTWGEISPRQIWHAGQEAMSRGNPGAEPFLRQIGWRDFAWHLLWHKPDMDRENWAPGWERFPWRHGPSDDLRAWQRGETGEPIVDAAMRELYVTGRMHNRARMIAASYLTKHLLIHWREGLAWFADCLTDWDAASNAMGWQWVAGSGPDASPFFRIFNPATQAANFDADRAYQKRWSYQNADYASAIPRSWGGAPTRPPVLPIVNLAFGRERALEAYRDRRTEPLEKF